MHLSLPKKNGLAMSRHPGESRGPEIAECIEKTEFRLCSTSKAKATPDCRNDEKALFGSFFECIKIKAASPDSWSNQIKNLALKLRSSYFWPMNGHERLAEKLKLLQFSIDIIPDVVYWVTTDGRISNVNTADCGMLGYSREELLFMSVHDIDPESGPDNDIDINIGIGIEISEGWMDSKEVVTAVGS
jgi:PAS domain-containing protein